LKFRPHTLGLLGLALILASATDAHIQTASIRSLGSTITSPEVPSSVTFRFVGEIIGHSYIKISLEPIPDMKDKQELVHLKGTWYEAISGSEYSVIGSYNAKTLTWKLNCFDKRNSRASVFVGKESEEGDITGKWTKNKTVRNFYLKKTD